MPTLGANTQCWHLPIQLDILVGANTECWHPVLTPMNTSRYTGRCRHWVLAPTNTSRHTGRCQQNIASAKLNIRCFEVLPQTATSLNRKIRICWQKNLIVGSEQVFSIFQEAPTFPRDILSSAANWPDFSLWGNPKGKMGKIKSQGKWGNREGGLDPSHV